jgi:uncharacterized protein YuzE
MRITYDNEAQASYVYFTPIDPAGSVETFSVRLDIGLDKSKQIATLRLFESEDCHYSGRLNYMRRHPQAAFDETSQSMVITFAPNEEIARVVPWDANIDLDKEGQILGIEILFACDDGKSDDGMELISADDKLEHLSKFIVGVDAL